jgi:hypothetical protein
MRSTGYRSLNRSIPPLNFAQVYNTMHRIKWPRLIRLVRQAQICPGDEIARAAAVDLAAELYLDDLESRVQQFLDQGLVKTVSTTSAAYRSSIPLSYDFVSFLVHGCCVDYWVSRIMICGLVLALSDISPAVPAMSQFDISSVMTEDVRAAERIIQCTEYSKAAYTAIPLTALRHIMPLKASWTAWNRYEIRARGYPEDEEEIARAQRMKRLCTDMAPDLGGKWGISRFASDAWERAYGSSTCRN